MIDFKQVKRTIKADLVNGQNDILVMNLPSCLDEDSIRVDGIGNAVIFDVIYRAFCPSFLSTRLPHQNYAIDSPEPLKDRDDSTNGIQDLKDEKARLEAELAILDGQSEVLSSYRKTLSGKDTDTETLISFLDKFASRQRQIHQETAQLRKELKEVDKQIDDASMAASPEQKNNAQRGTRVTIVVLAEGDGEAEISLTYVVSNASWKPLYDLRASIAPDSKSESAVHLHYRASISQSTGEDWSNVMLTLSTASPLQGTSVPTLNPLWIGKHEPPQQHFQPMSMSMKRAGPPPPGAPPAPPPPPAPSRAQHNLHDSVGGSSASSFGFAFKAPPTFFRGRDSTTTEGAVSATFLIPGRSSIPSDSDSSSQTHKVSIAEIPFQCVDLEWITVPKDIASVFLRVSIRLQSVYAILMFHM